MATQIAANGEKDELMQTFKALDTDDNGVLSEQELIQGFIKVYGFKEDEAKVEVKRIMREIDGNQSAAVDFTEFVVAVTDQDKLISKKKMEQAFNMFDLVISPSTCSQLKLLPPLNCLPKFSLFIFLVDWFTELNRIKMVI